MMSKYFVGFLIFYASYVSSSDNKLSVPANATSPTSFAYRRPHPGTFVSIPDVDSPPLTPGNTLIRQRPTESPSSYMVRIANIIYNRAIHNFDTAAARAYEVIQDVARGRDPVHHENDLVRSVLHEFNLILEDGSLNREIMRLYKNLNNE